MLYQQFLDELKSFADESYRQFHKKLLNNDEIKVLGVRVPILRKLAKKYAANLENLLTFPDEYYEVTFIKLTAVSLLPYDKFINYADVCVLLINNWATCDCFTPKCIAKHKEEFLPFVYKFLDDGKACEFSQRFALTTLLHYYVDEEHLPFIFKAVTTADLNYYYVHMAAAWLIAEAAVKYYDRTLEFLLQNYENGGKILNKKTHNKSIQKALESYRLTPERKIFLKGIKL